MLQNYIDLNYPFELEEENPVEPQFSSEEKELLPDVNELIAELPQSTSSTASNECGVLPEEDTAEEAEIADEEEPIQKTEVQVQEVGIIIEAEEAREEGEEIEDTRPVCASLDGSRRTRHLRRPDELSVPPAHCIVPIMENCQLRTERQSVDSLEKDGSSDRDSYRSRGNSKSEDSVSSDSSSGFRSGGYVSEDEPPPEYSKVVTVHYNRDEVV